MNTKITGQTHRLLDEEEEKDELYLQALIIPRLIPQT